MGATPTGRPLQLEATGAVKEVTRWLKPSVSVPRIGGSCECAGRNASELAAAKQVFLVAGRLFRGVEPTDSLTVSDELFESNRNLPRPGWLELLPR